MEKSKYLLSIFFLPLFHTVKLFRQKKGTTLAAASAFYFILTAIPSLLLILKLLGFFIGDVKGIMDGLFDLLRNLFPEALPNFSFTIKNIIESAFTASLKFTVLNCILLALSSMSFCNSILNGIYLMTEDNTHHYFSKYLKGLVIIIFSIIILTLALGVNPIIAYLFNSFNKLVPLGIVLQILPSLKSMAQLFHSIAASQASFFHSTFFYFLLFLFYFTLVYKWFFSWKIKWRESLAGSLSFVCVLVLGREVFWSYISYVRKSLIDYYGEFYTAIISLLWVFLVMNFFFFGACLCHTLHRKGVDERIRRS